MRFGVAIPQSGPFVAVDVQRRLAREIESLGFDSIWVSDHVIVPVGEGYIPEVMHEPLALLAWLAAETTSITLGTSVLILPYRDPVFTAKFVASVDVLAGGRVVLGVGAGWHEREFGALSADFARRGAVTDEYLRVIRNLWEEETSSFSGEWKRYEDMRLFPKGDRSRASTIPITVGGNSRRRCGGRGSSATDGIRSTSRRRSWPRACGRTTRRARGSAGARAGGAPAHAGWRRWRSVVG